MEMSEETTYDRWERLGELFHEPFFNTLKSSPITYLFSVDNDQKLECDGCGYLFALYFLGLFQPRQF